MIIYKRILGFVLAFIFAILIQASYYNPKFFFYGLGISILLLMFYFTRIKNRFVPKQEIMSYFWVCFVFLLSFWCFFVVSDNFYIRNFIVAFSVYFFIVIFDSIFKKIYENKPINSDVLRNVDLVIFTFFSFFSLFALIFIRTNPILNFVFVFFYSIICMNIRMYWNNLDSKTNKLSIFLIAFIISEIYLVLILLPFNLYFLTIILLLWYYLISSFVSEDISGEFLLRKKSTILIITGIFLLISFFTILKY